MKDFLFALILITAVVPFFLVWRIWAFIIIFLTPLVFFPQRNPTAGFGETYGYLLMIDYASLVGGIFIIRALLATLWYLTYRKTIPHDPELAAILSFPDLLLSSLGGVYTGVLVGLLAANFFAATEHGLITHLLLIVLPVMAIIFTFHMRKKFERTRQRHIWKYALTTLVTLAMFSVFSNFYPFLVIQSARSMAKGKPYCISLTNRGRPANSLQDLTLYTLDKAFARHHAILRVARDGRTDHYHWSYRVGKFLPGDWNGGISYCSPKRNFAKDLGIF